MNGHRPRAPRDARSPVPAGTALLLALVLAGPPAGAAFAASAASDSTARDSSAAARDTSGAARPVPADSLPSADAKNVLRTIPEPLTPDEEGTPPDSLIPAPPVYASPDTTAADTSGVPTPAETAPLGETAGAASSVFSDSLGAVPGSGAASAPPPATPGPGAAPAPAAPPASTAGGRAANPAAADTCWRLQLAAPLARPEAEAKRQAAESQLLVKFTIEVEQGRNKVRTLDCLNREMGEALKARALLSGFDGAFLLRFGPDGKPIPANPPTGAGAKKSPAKTSGSKPATTKSATAKSATSKKAPRR